MKMIGLGTNRFKFYKSYPNAIWNKGVEVSLYTIILIFRGTPIVRQVKADNVNSALVIWANKPDLPESKIPSIPLHVAIASDRCVRNKELVNVWSSFLFLGKDKFGQDEMGIVIVSVTQIDTIYQDVNLGKKK